MQTAKGHHPEKPFVLLSQPSIFDPTRAPEGKHTAWAYCHVPNGSTFDMTNAIESQIERFGPGFKERILAKHTFNTAQLQNHNPNFIGAILTVALLICGSCLPVRRCDDRRTPPHQRVCTSVHHQRRLEEWCMVCAAITPLNTRCKIFFTSRLRLYKLTLKYTKLYVIKFCKVQVT
uniref:phytoene desaturase family protein n=1 Tax=Mucilaginibacter sp. Bleaf8 TaxID=2834430 RepID=UPI0032DF0992